MAKTTYLSIISLNVNGLNVPIKRQQLAKWIKKAQNTSICCLPFISELKVHRDWTWNYEIRYSMQIEMKRKLG